MTLDGTNSWVLRAPGADACLVVDPGPLDEAHLAALAAHAPVAAVLLTHGHPDHRDGLARFQEITGAPLVDTSVPTGPGVRLDRLVTPGHTSDSVCFVAECGGERVVLTGDTILGRGTTVVAHPDGDLGDYLASLRRLIELGPMPVLPGHGPALRDCAAAATFYLEHRLARLDQVRAARAAGARDAAAILATVYADVERALWPAATSSIEAQLAYLDRQAEEMGGAPAGLDTA
jgi:glyoxylase-like metal-dependent hydrolase (beta-lactamase superfamily II)